MARKSRFTIATRLVIGAVIFIIVMFAVTNFTDLTVSPFKSGFDFRQVDSVFQQFSVASTTDLQKYIKGTASDILAKNCYLKLHSEVKLKDGRIIPLDSPFQTFNELTPFTLTTPSGTEISEFKNIELRMRCDVVESIDGQRLPFEVIPSATNPIVLYIYAYNEVGQHPQIRGEQLKSFFEFFSGVPQTVGGGLIVNPPQKIVFDDSRQPDPLTGKGGELFIGSERAISKAVSFSASALESAIDSTNPLTTKSTFSSEITFAIAGAFDLNIPYLQTKVAGFPHRIPVDQGLIKNQFDFVLKKPTTTTTVPSTTKLTTTVNSVDPSKLVTDGTNDIQVFVTAFVSLNNYDATLEGKPTGTMKRTDFDIIDPFTTATSLCSPSGSDGINSLFKCTFALRQNIEVGTYQIDVGTKASNRSHGFKTIDVVRSGIPVGTGCPDGQYKNALGICVLFGSTGETKFSCPSGQVLNSQGQCIIPSGGGGGEESVPCPDPAQFRDNTGTCVTVSGSPALGAKACSDCNSNIVRYVKTDDMCPVFRCSDGSTTGDGSPICEDLKPAEKTEEGWTCSRATDLTKMFNLPKIIPCEQGETAGENEVCVDPIIYGIFQNYNFVWLGLGFIILILVIAIIASAVKKTTPTEYFRGY